MNATEEKEMEAEYKDWLPAKVLLKTVVTDEGGNVLVSRRTKRDWDKRSEKYDINGGALDKKDIKIGSKPHEKGIGREVLEETGLPAKNIKPVNFFDSGVKISTKEGNIPVLVIGFSCKVDGIKPEVKLDSNEHAESKWVTKEEALLLDFGDDGGMCKGIIEKAFDIK